MLWHLHRKTVQLGNSHLMENEEECTWLFLVCFLDKETDEELKYGQMFSWDLFYPLLIGKSPDGFLHPNGGVDLPLYQYNGCLHSIMLENGLVERFVRRCFAPTTNGERYRSTPPFLRREVPKERFQQRQKTRAKRRFFVLLAGLVIRFNQHALLFQHTLSISLLLYQSWLWPECHCYVFLGILRDT